MFLSKGKGPVQKHTWATQVHIFQKPGQRNLAGEEATGLLVCVCF